MFRRHLPSYLNLFEIVLGVGWFRTSSEIHIFWKCRLKFQACFRISKVRSIMTARLRQSQMLSRRYQSAIWFDWLDRRDRFWLAHNGCKEPINQSKGVYIKIRQREEPNCFEKCSVLWNIQMPIHRRQSGTCNLSLHTKACYLWVRYLWPNYFHRTSKFLSFLVILIKEDVC